MADNELPGEESLFVDGYTSKDRDSGQSATDSIGQDEDYEDVADQCAGEDEETMEAALSRGKSSDSRKRGLMARTAPRSRMKCV